MGTSRDDRGGSVVIVDVPEGVDQHARKHPGLTALPVKLPDIRQPVGITTLKNRSLSPVAQMFIESVRELVKPLANRR